MIRLAFLFRLCIGLLCTFLTRLPAVAQVQEYKQLSPDERIVRVWAEFLSLKKIDTISLFRWANDVQIQAKALNDERLYWYPVFLKVHGMAMFQSMTGKPVMAYANAETLIETIPVDVVRACFYCYYGQDLFTRHRNFTEGHKFLLRAKAIFEKIGYEHVPEAIIYLRLFGDDYYWFEDYRMAIHYMELAARFRCDTLVKQYYCQNTLALSYMQLKEYAKSIKAFQNVIQLAKGRSTDWVGIGSNGYGHVLILLGKHRDALPHLYRDVALNSVRVPESAALSCLFIAQSLLALDSTAKAGLYIEKARKLYNGYVFSHYWVNYYETLTAYYRKRGNYPKAILYSDSTLALKDSLKAVFGNRALSLAESRSQAEQYMNDLLRTETEKQNAIWLRNSIIGALTLFALLALYALNQRRQKLQQEKQVQEEQRKRADEQLMFARTQLDQYIANLKEKNDLIVHISGQLATYQPDSPEQIARQQDQIKVMLSSVILTDADWRQFRALFEQVHPGFLESLRATHPDLTPAETRLLALLKLGVSSKEIAYMSGVSPESIRKSRYRLRKKLESLAVSTDLQALVKEL